MASSAVGPPLPRKRGLKRFVRRWALFLVVGYLVVCFVMWLLENRLVFFPATADMAWEPAPVADIQDVELTSPAGTKLHAWSLPAPANSPTLLIFPGNAGNLSFRGPTLVRIRERLGTGAMIVDYPGYGKSEGKPSEPACYDAGEAAIRWLRDVRGVPSEQVIFYGESLGGGVATEMATRYPCRALVLVKTFTSLPAVAKQHYPWLPTHWLMSNRFDNLTKVPAAKCPVFVASATADRVVPFEHGERLFAAASEPRQFFRDEGDDHNDPLPDEFWSELRTFLARTGR